MHTGVEMPVTGDNLTMRDAILIMAEKRFGCIGITGADGRLDGIVTDGDLRRHMTGDLLEAHVRDIMTPDPITTTPDALAMEVIARMNETKIGAIFVVQEGRPVGIAHLHDFLRAGVA